MNYSKYFIRDNPLSTNKKKIRIFIHAVLNTYYSIKQSFFKCSTNNKKYNVSICAIFKNEAPYLKEWIEFHRIVGVEHFYLYNNNSNDDYLKVIKPYIDDGIVTLVQWPTDQAQMQAYRDCVHKFSSETKWIGFIDIDEFVVPKTKDDIYSFLEPFEHKAGAVIVYWRLFGSSGRMKRDLNELVTEDFTVCWPKYCDIGKCFYNTAFELDDNEVRNSALHHRCITKYRGRVVYPVNLFGHVCVSNDVNPVYERDTNGLVDLPIQINHYFTKSYEEYAMKRSKGDVYFKVNPHDEEYFYYHEMKCTSTDYSAYKYLIKLKNRMYE